MIGQIKALSPQFARTWQSKHVTDCWLTRSQVARLCFRFRPHPTHEDSLRNDSMDSVCSTVAHQRSDNIIDVNIFDHVPKRNLEIGGSYCSTVIKYPKAIVYLFIWSVYLIRFVIYTDPPIHPAIHASIFPLHSGPPITRNPTIKSFCDPFSPPGSAKDGIVVLLTNRHETGDSQQIVHGACG